MDITSIISSVAATLAAGGLVGLLRVWSDVRVLRSETDAARHILDETVRERDITRALSEIDRRLARIEERLDARAAPRD